MCGRYTLSETTGILIEHYQGQGEFDWKASYNIAPTQEAPVVVERDTGREVDLMKWGLIPFWAKDKKIGNSMINARAETVQEKPGFRDSFKTKRCVVPASGFYEWQKLTSAKIPYYFTPKEGLFSFAGLWSRWISPENIEVESFTIITTEANVLVKPIHDRMPVILGHNSWSAWLAKGTKASELQKLLSPYPASQMQMRQVSKLVNSVKNNRPECIREIKT